MEKPNIHGRFEHKMLVKGRGYWAFAFVAVTTVLRNQIFKQ
jgi:hypothetical protein